MTKQGIGNGESSSSHVIYLAISEVSVADYEHTCENTDSVLVVYPRRMSNDEQYRTGIE